MNLFELTKTLIDIPSVSENEMEVGFFLRDYLQKLGWTVELQAVSENQNNVIAYLNNEAIKKTAKKREVFLHMDGARLWETRGFYRKTYKEICRGFDSVYVSFYKGIGALTGAMLLGNAEFIEESRIWLRRFGGNLYQLHPFVASAAMRFDHALKQMPERLRRTKEVYKLLKNIPNISFCPNPPQVNMFHLYFNLKEFPDSLLRGFLIHPERV